MSVGAGINKRTTALQALQGADLTGAATVSLLEFNSLYHFLAGVDDHICQSASPVESKVKIQPCQVPFAHVNRQDSSCDRLQQRHWQGDCACASRSRGTRDPHVALAASW